MDARRTMRVYYRTHPKGWLLPMIRISNLWLMRAGFRLGDTIEVQYLKDQIVIKKIASLSRKEFGEKYRLQK